jgi:hypothetical protein
VTTFTIARLSLVRPYPARQGQGLARPCPARGWEYAVPAHRLVTGVRAVHARGSRGVRCAIYALGLAILVGGGLAFVLPGHPPGAASRQLRSDDRASRDEVRLNPTATSTAAPTPTPSTAPPIPAASAPAVVTTAPKVKAAVPAPPVVAAGCSGYSGNRLVACNLLPSFGFATSEMTALDPMWDRESGWSISAANPSGAYGIPQALPGSKMATAGSDWRTNPATQVSWGLGYIKSRYGSPSAAWSYWQGHGWY